MDANDVMRAAGAAGAAYLILFPCAVLYRYRRLSTGLATVAGAAMGAIISLIALLPRFEPVGPSVVAVVVATGGSAIAVRYVVNVLDRLLRRS